MTVRSPRWWPAPSLRARMALLAALAVFVAVTLAGSAAFGLTLRVLSDQIDTSLREGLGFAPTGQPTSPPAGPQTGLPAAPQTGLPAGPGGGTARPGAPQLCALASSGNLGAGEVALTIVTVIGPDGQTCAAAGRVQVVVQDRDRAAAQAGTGGGLRDGTSTSGERLRVLVRPLGGGYAVLVGRSLAELEAVSRRVGIAILLISLVGALLALGLGFAVARAGLRPVDRLTEAAEEVTRTNDLALRIEVPQRRPDEVTRLAGSFNAMIAALASARDRQAQLVADAGHELRTPLTSLRTNIELLVRSEQVGRPLPPVQRTALLAGLTAQLAELGQLVDELVVLAREEPAPTMVPVRLDSVVEAAVDRARRRAGERTVRVVANDPWLVDGDAASLERALVNLLDNAVKFSPPTSAVTVRQSGGRVTVDDAGPGVPAEDREVAFDRFWRSDTARALPGSGLGLAIVADAASLHGGSAHLTMAPGGGARAVLMVPGRRADHDNGLS